MVEVGRKRFTTNFHQSRNRVDISRTSDRYNTSPITVFSNSNETSCSVIFTRGVLYVMLRGASVQTFYANFVCNARRRKREGAMTSARTRRRRARRRRERVNAGARQRRDHGGRGGASLAARRQQARDGGKRDGGATATSARQRRARRRRDCGERGGAIVVSISAHGSKKEGKYCFVLQQLG